MCASCASLGSTPRGQQQEAVPKAAGASKCRSRVGRWIRARPSRRGAPMCAGGRAVHASTSNTRRGTPLLASALICLGMYCRAGRFSSATSVRIRIVCSAPLQRHHSQVVGAHGLPDRRIAGIDTCRLLRQPPSRDLIQHNATPPRRIRPPGTHSTRDRRNKYWYCRRTDCTLPGIR